MLFFYKFKIKFEYSSTNFRNSFGNSRANVLVTDKIDIFGKLVYYDSEVIENGDWPGDVVDIVNHDWDSSVKQFNAITFYDMKSNELTQESKEMETCVSDNDEPVAVQAVKFGFYRVNDKNKIDMIFLRKIKRKVMKNGQTDYFIGNKRWMVLGRRHSDLLRVFYCTIDNTVTFVLNDHFDNKITYNLLKNAEDKAKFVKVKNPKLYTAAEPVTKSVQIVPVYDVNCVVADAFMRHVNQDAEEKGSLSISTVDFAKQIGDNGL